MKHYLSTQTRGFTLVETLVAIAILVTVITGAFSAAQSGISASILAKNEIISFYLAQEGIEQIRNMRDENGLRNIASPGSVNWLFGIAAQPSDPCYFGTPCRVDVINNSLVPCPLSSCPVIRQDSVNGYYGYDGEWAPTIFTRTITLSRINDNEVTILVEIDWSKGVVSRTFRAKENIMNWQ